MDKEKEKLIINNIQNLAKKLNKAPRKKDYVKEYKSEVFEKFGGYSRLLEKAGFIPFKRINMTKEEIIKMFIEYYKEHHTVPSSMHIPKELPFLETIQYVFNEKITFNELMIAIDRPKLIKNIKSQSIENIQENN